MFDPIGVIVAGTSGGIGSQPNELSLPYGLYIDSNNSLYIADVGNDRIQFWKYGATTGTTVAGGHGFGSNASQVFGPRTLYVDSANNLIVMDTGNQRIQRYNLSSGSRIGTTIASNLPLNTRNMFHDPTTDKLYLSDIRNHSIILMPNRTVVAGGNGFGNQSHQLAYPAGLFVTPTGTIYVADSFNDRVQMYRTKCSLCTVFDRLCVLGGNLVQAPVLLSLVAMVEVLQLIN